MPRPTLAQLAYGSATVVLSTLVMLLVSGAQSGLAVMLVAVAALALGTLAATAVSPSRRGSRATRPAESVVPVSAASSRPRTRVREHSLHR